MPSCEADRTVPSLFWQQVRRLRGNEEEENRGIKDEDKGKEEALRRHWKEIFKIQPKDNIEFDEENKKNGKSTRQK